VKFHFTNLKLRENHFYTEKLIGKYQISKSRRAYLNLQCPFYCDIPTRVFFHVTVRSLLLPRILKSTALRVEVKPLYTAIMDGGCGGSHGPNPTRFFLRGLAPHF